MQIAFEIEGEPVAKGRPRLNRNGHVFTPRKTHLYENFVRVKAKEAMRGKKPLSRPVAITLTAFFGIPKSWSKKKKAAADMGPHAKKPDLDNVVKAVVDGMNGIVFEDDSLVFQVTAKKIYSTQARVEVVIEEKGGEIDQ